MPRLIDADELVRTINKLSEGAGFYKPIYEGFSKAVKNQPTIDAVPVETVAQMFFDFTGDKCPCNFNNNDEWLPSVCEYEAEGKCPDPEDVLGCWKQYIKHYGERKDGEG